MSKFISKLIVILALGGCASSKIKVEEAKKIRKVAVVGFTMDYSQSFKENFKSTLKGEQKTQSPNGFGVINGAFAKAEPLAQNTYKAVIKSLKKTGWDVLSYKETVKSPSLKNYYNKKVKKGYFPLVKGKSRIAAKGIPQHYYIEGLRKSPILDSIAKELGVDALVFAYSNTTKKCMGVMGNCVNTPKYNSQVMITVYDAIKDHKIVFSSFKGPNVKKQAQGKYKMDRLKTAMWMANIKAFEGVSLKINDQIK
jgi:hypothetical protein